MTEASWGDAATPAIDWRMSAALENVPRGDDDLAEVTSLEQAVRAWVALDPEHQRAAVLTPERPVMIDGATMAELTAHGIAALVARLPGAARPADADDGVDDAG